MNVTFHNLARPCLVVALNHLRLASRQSRFAAGLIAMAAWLGVVSNLRANEPVSDIDARHSNMVRFYKAEHPDPPPKRTLAQIRAAAERGEADAQNQMGDLCSRQMDWGNALDWYKKAAKAGDTNAMYHTGDFLLFGRAANANSRTPVLPDYEGGLNWMGQAASKGDARAQLIMGNCFIEGKGVEPDLREAYKWFALASRQTNSAARQAMDKLALKLSTEEAAAAQARVDNFIIGSKFMLPEPAYLKELKLTGISGAAGNRLVMINNKTLGLNEQASVKLKDRTVQVRCIEIRDRSVLVAVGAFTKELELSSGH